MCRYHLYVQMKKRFEGEAKNVILGAFAGHYDVKQVVVVDEDVNIHDPAEVEWAVATRSQADRDLVVVSECAGLAARSVERNGVSAKMGIDATMPLDAPEFRYKRIRIPGEDSVDLAAVIAAHDNRRLAPVHLTELLRMLDLGTSFLASVARDPNALAIVDGDVRLTYRANGIGASRRLVAGFDAIGLKAGDHLVTALQNRWEAATLHWACQFAGIIITPVNWRSTASEIDFYLEDAEAKAIVYEDISADGRGRDRQAHKRCRGSRSMRRRPAEIAFAALASDAGAGCRARASTPTPAR